MKVVFDQKKQCVLDLVKLLLMFGIIARHATMENIDAAYPIFHGFSRGVIGISEICVPLFFVISGFLFFLNVPEKPKPEYFLNKLKRRFISLVIPYLIANCVALAVYFCAHKFAPQLLSGFMGDNWKNPIYIFWTGPINLSLWFIRELILVVILSPLVYLLVRYCRIFGVLALGALWIFKIGPAPIFFFSLGAWFSICGGIRTGNGQEVAPKTLKFYKNSRSWSFFMYLYHYIPLIALKKVLYVFLSPTTDWLMFVIYLTSLVTVIVFISLIYLALKKLLPRFLGVLVGGRPAVA